MKQRFLFVALCVFVTLSSCRNNGDEVQALILNETEIEIVKGETFQLEARSYPQQDGATFSWFSEKEEYVKVDDNGLVTAVGRYFKEEDDKEVTPVPVFDWRRNPKRNYGIALNHQKNMAPMGFLDGHSEGLKSNILKNEYQCNAVLVPVPKF